MNKCQHIGVTAYYHTGKKVPFCFVCQYDELKKINQELVELLEEIEEYLCSIALDTAGCDIHTKIENALKLAKEKS